MKARNRGTSPSAIKQAIADGIPLTRKQRKAKKQRDAQPESGKIYSSKYATHRGVWVYTDWAGSGYIASVPLTDEERANPRTKEGCR
jgi:hypothetical protein